MEGTFLYTDRPVRPSFGEIMAACGEQVELEDLIGQEPDRAGIYHDIVRAMADVYVHRTESPSRVEDGIEYGILQEVYADLTAEHVRFVAERFVKYPRRVFSPRLFFQTVLYNVLGEFESGLENAVRVRG